jgi:hypothetical protein
VWIVSQQGLIFIVIYTTFSLTKRAISTPNAAISADKFITIWFTSKSPFFSQEIGTNRLTL